MSLSLSCGISWSTTQSLKKISHHNIWLTAEGFMAASNLNLPLSDITKLQHIFSGDNEGAELEK